MNTENKSPLVLENGIVIKKPFPSISQIDDDSHVSINVNGYADLASKIQSMISICAFAMDGLENGQQGLSHLEIRDTLEIVSSLLPIGEFETLDKLRTSVNK